ncbi:hypothetical protein RQP46_008846 [Phenoliferia psychrophenolica]
MSENNSTKTMPPEVPNGTVKICQLCLRLVGKGTGCKTLRYSFYSLAVEKSAKDWPTHKPLCARRRKAEERVEENALAAPKEALVLEDLVSYQKLIHNEVMCVLRTPLRVGKRDELHSTSQVVLEFKYDGSPKDLARRFSLTTGAVHLTADLIKNAATASDKAAFQRVGAWQQNPSRGKETIRGEIYTGIIYNFRYQTDPVHQPKKWTTLSIPTPVLADSSSWSDPIPVEDPAFSFDGVWGNQNVKGVFSTWSNSSSAVLHFQFKGVAVQYFASKKYDRGRCKLTLDGGDGETVDLYIPQGTSDNTLIWESALLDYGNHTVTISQIGPDSRIGATIPQLHNL